MHIYFQELKEILALERKKFESSDTGKSSQSQITTYEVSNLIDDYKKVGSNKTKVNVLVYYTTILF